jgi:hypothetical protein
VASAPEVLAAGGEPGGRVRVGWSPPRRLRIVTGVAGALLVAVAAAASWFAGRSDLARTVTVAVDRSEYTLPHPADAAGNAPLLLLLRVDPAGGTDQPLVVTDIHGGGVDAIGRYAVGSGDTHRAVVQATVSCPSWVGGTGVRVQVLVGQGSDTVAREATLDLGPGAPLHAQVDETCARWRAAYAPGGVLLVGPGQGRSERAAELAALLGSAG